jgi:uncharacterized protein
VSGDTLTKSIKTSLDQDDRILLAYVFGSVARGDVSEGSDVDVAVLTREALDLDALGRLGETLARAIDHQRGVDIVDLRAASPLLAAEVVRDGIRIVERDPTVRFDFEMDAVRRFEDTRPLRRVQQELLREAANGRP